MLHCDLRVRNFHNPHDFRIRFSCKKIRLNILRINRTARIRFEWVQSVVAARLMFGRRMELKVAAHHSIPVHGHPERKVASCTGMAGKWRPKCTKIARLSAIVTVTSIGKFEWGGGFQEGGYGNSWAVLQTEVAIASAVSNSSKSSLAIIGETKDMVRVYG